MQIYLLHAMRRQPFALRSLLFSEMNAQHYLPVMDGGNMRDLNVQMICTISYNPIGNSGGKPARYVGS